MLDDPEMKEIVDAFVSEGYERLEEAESQLSSLQEAVNHEQIIQTIFRLFHSLKGSAGYLNFENIKQLTHEAESLLDIFRKTGVKPSQEDVDLIYRTMDFLRQLLDNVANNLTDECVGDQIDLVIKDLTDASVRQLRERIRQEVQSETSLSSESRVEQVSRKTDSDEKSIPHVTTFSDRTSEDIPVIEEEIPVYEEIPVEVEGEERIEEILLEPDVLKGDVDRQKELSQESEKLLETCQEEEYVVSAEGAEFVEVRCEEEPSNIHMIQEEVIALSEGAESALVLSRKEEAEKEVRDEKEEGVASQEPSSPFTIPQFSLENLVTPEMVERFRSETGELLDEAEQAILQLETTNDRTELIQSIFRSIHTIKGNASFLNFERIATQTQTLENILDNLRGQTMPFTPAVTELLLRGIDYIRRDLVRLNQQEEESSESDYKPLGEILVQMGAVDKEEVEEALLQKEKPLGEILIEKGVVSEETVNEALKKQLGMTESFALGIHKREIRVDASRLDRLFDLMGELINAEAMVLHHPLVKNIQDDGFQKFITHLTKISRELQEVTMEVRMVPLEGLFIRMHRLVRDLSRKCSKSIEFRIVGQENEIDKNLIDQILDPLVHLLRNALDHGIESPEERRLVDKPEKGLVELSAQYQGNEIWISVRDDGRGLDREKILSKAKAKGLLQKSPEEMSDSEVWRLIFLPGFSTKEEVTDVSGRGVGMDVVIKNIERLRGQVDIATVPGKGTTITMKIPLTMAILDGVVCRAGEVLFILPLADIVEFFKPVESQLTRGERNAPLINLRGEILPVLDLEEVFYHQSCALPLPQRILVVVSSQEKKMAVAVDEILASQQVVVKSLSDFVGRIEGMIGCSILNEGQIGFIVDVKGLAKRVFE